MYEVRRKNQVHTSSAINAREQEKQYYSFTTPAQGHLYDGVLEQLHELAFDVPVASEETDHFE